MLVAGVSGLLYPARMKRAMDEITKSTLLPYLDGALALVVGLLIVLTHNVWTDLTSGLVSLFGWVALVEGFAMLLLPEDTLKGLMRSLSGKSVATVVSIAAVVIGGYLLYVGFF